MDEGHGAGADALVGGRYRLQTCLGHGGMGTVWAALDLRTGTTVALKLLDRAVYDRSALERFRREATAAAALESEHVVRVCDFCSEPPGGEDPYLVMELLEGEDGAALVERAAPLDPRAALRIVGQVCEGLALAHAVGIVHRDLKPSNVFVAGPRHGGDGPRVVKILDFGIAKIPSQQTGGDASLTTTGVVMGSPRYMSPEQAQGLRTMGVASDVWSLGILLFELLTGHNPYDTVDTVGQAIVAICSGPLPDPEAAAPWLEPDVVALLRRVLVRDVEHRLADAAAMLEAVRAVLGGPTASLSLRASDIRPVAPEVRGRARGPLALAPTVSARTEPPVPRRRRVAAAVAGLVVAASAVAVALVGARTHAAPSEVVASSSAAAAVPSPSTEAPVAPPDPAIIGSTGEAAAAPVASSPRAQTAKAAPAKSAASSPRHRVPKGIDPVFH